MPRAATSVATRASTAPRTKGSRAFSRCFWLRSPWMAAARTPRCSSWRAIRSVPCLVRLNTMVGSGGGDHVGRPVDPVTRGHLPEEVHGGVGVVLVDLELVAGRVVLVAADQDVDVAVEGGREQQGLAVRRA